MRGAKRVGGADSLRKARKPAVLVMHACRRRVDRDREGGEPGAGQCVDTLRIQEPTIRHDDGRHRKACSMRHDRREVAVHERLAADQKEISHIVAREDVEGRFRVLQAHALLRVLGQPVDREIAERAAGIADAGDSEVTGAGPAVEESFRGSAPEGDLGRRPSVVPCCVAKAVRRRARHGGDRRRCGGPCKLDQGPISAFK